MEFHWHKGNCLPAEEWKTIAVCMQQIGKAIYQPCLGGCTENGRDYYAVDFICTPNEIKELAEILNDFVKSMYKEVRQMSRWCEKCTHEPYISCSKRCPACGLSYDEALAKVVMPHNNRSKAEQCLIDNGIEPDEAPVVLQALGYILLDEELYPEEESK